MKIKLSEFKKAIRTFLIENLNSLKAEDDDRVRRAKDGYGDDLEEDTDRLKRAEEKYGETPFEESLDNMSESSPNQEKKREDFIRNNKSSFKKQYGKNWEKILYATANEKFGGKK